MKNRRIAAYGLLLTSLALASVSVASADDASASTGYVVGSTSFSGRYPAGEKIARIGGKPNFRCNYYSLGYKSFETNQEKKKGGFDSIPRNGHSCDEEEYERQLNADRN